MKTWEKTRLQNMVRHKSGRYYARAFEGGKEIWKTLRTSHFSVAQAKLAFMKEHREREKHAEGVAAGRMAFGEVLALHQSSLDDSVRARRMKPTTAHYWRQIFAALRKSWPGLEGRDVRKISAPDCKAWSAAFAKKASSCVCRNPRNGGELRAVRAMAQSQ